MVFPAEKSLCSLAPRLSCRGPAVIDYLRAFSFLPFTLERLGCSSDECEAMGESVSASRLGMSKQDTGVLSSFVVQCVLEWKWLNEEF